MTALKDPLVYIILVNWNGRDDSLACLRSLSMISYPRFQIILVDNASTDGSVEAIRKEFAHITIIENENNEMFARANNQGIDLAMERGAEFVLLLNNDTEVDAEFLSFLIKTAHSDPRIGIVGPKIFFYDRQDVLWFAGGIVNLWKGQIAHVGIRQIDRGQFDEVRESDYITACCILVHRDCLDKIGGLDDKYYIYCEDVDWCCRARQAGFRIMYEPRARVWHKVSSSSGGQSVAGGLTPFKVYHKTRSIFLFLRRYAKWYQWITIPFFSAGYFIKTVVLMIRDRNWAGLGAILSVFGRKKT